MKMMGEAKGEKSGKEFSSKTTKTVTKSGSTAETSKVSVTNGSLSVLLLPLLARSLTLLPPTFHNYYWLLLLAVEFRG